MLSLIFLLILAAIIIFWVVGYKAAKDGKEGTNIISVIMVIILLVADCVIGVHLYYDINKVGTSHTIEEKIIMYQEENAKIEESVNLLVQKYMQYEQNTYSNLKSESVVQLVSLFPELKSDELVIRQINIYVSNNAKIKELKNQQIDISQAKWRVYFGK